MLVEALVYLIALIKTHNSLEWYFKCRILKLVTNYTKEILKMFTLLRGLWDYFFKKDEYFVVILGLDNAGKTVGRRDSGMTELAGT